MWWVKAPGASKKEETPSARTREPSQRAPLGALLASLGPWKRFNTFQSGSATGHSAVTKAAVYNGAILNEPNLRRSSFQSCNRISRLYAVDATLQRQHQNIHRSTRAPPETRTNKPVRPRAAPHHNRQVRSRVTSRRLPAQSARRLPDPLCGPAARRHHDHQDLRNLR